MMKFECGMIDDGEFAGLYVLPLAVCMKDSSWDFASFAMFLGIESLSDTMHPTQDDILIVAKAVDISHDEITDFVLDFPLDWDT